MSTVLISLGSNIGDSKDIIRSACNDISSLPCVSSCLCSSLYITKPVGYLLQDDFVNAALVVQTDANPIDFLHSMQDLEHKYKRVRLFKDGPRTLDIDLISYDEIIMNTQELTLPHPRMHERAFVLAPLKEIAPNYIITKFNKTIEQLYDLLSDEEKNGVRL